MAMVAHLYRTIVTDPQGLSPTLDQREPISSTFNTELRESRAGSSTQGSPGTETGKHFGKGAMNGLLLTDIIYTPRTDKTVREPPETAFLV
ncbi:hypothetical protein N7456_004912 [Penicillium angulare]|uniref:Uncharacterized protein n=1 Tax=Penicillium angulare TaxID=116970 RepID=A0A9W9FXG5_9EURO|nr:hypothetical protein N7456_004912 [Penicillium angulare]